MTDTTSRAFYMLLIFLILISCDSVIREDDRIVLTKLGDRELLLEDVKHNVSAERYENDSLNVINQYRNNWITRQLKVREAKRLNLEQNENVARRIRKAKESILVDAFNQAVYLEVPEEPVSRSEAQSYYESNKEKFLLAEQHVRFRHMIASSHSDAENARNAIQRGESWRNIAEQYSINPQQAVRKSKQYHAISSAAIHYESMNHFLQTIGVTEISSIRRIDNHYHFVQLMERREAGEHPQIDWIIDQIAEWLTIDQRRKYLRSMEQNLFLQAQANNELKIYDVRKPEQKIEIVTDSL